MITMGVVDSVRNAYAIYRGEGARGAHLVKNGQAVEYDMPLFAVEKI